MSPRRIEVAAAVLTRGDSSFLLAQRPAGKPYTGYWEFPGGKVEDGESPENALARELHEELGIEVERAYRWITRDYDYPHAAVRLRFFRVPAWRGTLQGKEAQPLAWQRADQVTVAPLLPANGPILRALALPPIYGISDVAAYGKEEFLRRAARALESGMRLVQFREKILPAGERQQVGHALVELGRSYGARIMVNDDPELVRGLGADGLHLTSAHLMRLNKRPDFRWIGASCHNQAELEQAVRIGADFVVLGPVLRTPSHPNVTPIGWERFAMLTRDYPLPVYALGGLQKMDLEIALQAGAHGISMVRGAWN